MLNLVFTVKHEFGGDRTLEIAHSPRIRPAHDLALTARSSQGGPITPDPFEAVVADLAFKPAL